MKTKNYKTYPLLLLSAFLIISAIIMAGCIHPAANGETIDSFTNDTNKNDSIETANENTAKPLYKNAPQDFSLNLHWSTGTLPPQYCYSYNISCGPGLKGTFEYQAGYESEPTPEAWISEFNISAESMDYLYTLLQEGDFFKELWEKSEPSEGGSYTVIKIIANSNIYEIPPDFKLKPEDVQKINKVSDYLKNLVPQTVWHEMEKRQEEYEKAYQEYEI